MQNRASTQEPPVWLSLGRAAFYLGVSEPTLRKWTDEGRVGAFRTPGGHRRYQQAELDRFRAAQLESVEDVDERREDKR